MLKPSSAQLPATTIYFPKQQVSISPAWFQKAKAEEGPAQSLGTTRSTSPELLTGNKEEACQQPPCSKGAVARWAEGARRYGLPRHVVATPLPQRGIGVARLSHDELRRTSYVLYRGQS